MLIKRGLADGLQPDCAGNIKYWRRAVEKRGRNISCGGQSVSHVQKLWICAK